MREEDLDEEKDFENVGHTSYQRQRQGEWLAEHRSYKKQLEHQGVKGFALLEAMAALNLEHRIAGRHNRCQKCWHCHNACICSQLVPIDCFESLDNVEILIWMHHKEYLGAGNSAKLLLQLLPNHTSLYVTGRKGDMECLERKILSDIDHCAILWPSEQAESVAKFLEGVVSKDSEQKKMHEDSAIPVSGLSERSTPKLRFLLLDGTYTNARNMYKSLRKRLGCSRIPLAIKVDPASASVFHRAKKNYGAAHLQHTIRSNGNEVRRVSTAEACGLLLTALSGNNVFERRIIDAVEANNKGLAFARGGLDV